jgi:hypothetical protein
VEVGLLTNGEDWRLLIASPSETASWLTWTVQTWADSPITLAAFTELLGEARFFAGPKTGTILQLVRQSRIRQADVADRLGQQVREALDILVRDLDRIDYENGGELLRSYNLDDIYEAAVVLMMRLLFLLKAEESELLPHGNIHYARSYGVLHLLTHLENSHRHDPEKLSRSHEAFAQLLGTFRLVHEGSVDPDINVAPYGGLLFDPASYPLLEGRNKDGTWSGADNAKGLPIRDSVVRQVLRSLKYARGDAGIVQLVSYRTLAVEQIGHMYEGLLDRRVARASTKGALLLLVSADKEDLPEIAAAELASLDKNELVSRLTKITGRTEDAVRSLLEPQPEKAKQPDFGTTDPGLMTLAKPMLRLLRPRGIVRPGGLYVTFGADRRSQGAHYTPAQLTEPIVRYALEPLVYDGPAQGKPRDEWKLRTPRELLSLRLCDVAMGSGAFLVQAVRFLGDCLVKAWDDVTAEATGKVLTLPFALPSKGDTDERLLPDDHSERLISACRYVAELCIYGIDKNHLAVEMAKLSLWLETLSKDKPFTFLDHALRCGDSLIGLTSLEQIENFHMCPARGKEIHHTLFAYTAVCGPALQASLEKRAKLEGFPVVTVRDAQRKRQLLQEAEEAIAQVRIIADLIVGASLATATKGDRALDNKLLTLAPLIFKAFDKGTNANDRKQLLESMTLASKELLNDGNRSVRKQRVPFHYPLEFPELFGAAGLRTATVGFSSVVGNPPYLSGVRITEVLGEDYNSFLSKIFPPASRKTDLCAFFFRRAGSLLGDTGTAGLLGTNTISQGTTRKGGLTPLLADGFEIIRALPSFKWPGKASVFASLVVLVRGSWAGKRYMEDTECLYISDYLTPQESRTAGPQLLLANKGMCFQGSSMIGTGFFVTPEAAHDFLRSDPANAEVTKPAVGGEELNNQVGSAFKRWIIDFGERAEEEARRYAGPFSHVENYVKSERMLWDPHKYPRLVKTWWKYYHTRQDLYLGITAKKLGRVLARARISDHHMIEYLPLGVLYTEELVVFLLDSWGSFALLQSVLHEEWVRIHASTMKRDIRYIPTDCFGTFPMPTELSALDSIATIYHDHRSAIIREQQLGLTRIYNRFHNQAEQEGSINRLRDLQIEMDTAVARLYGWDDIDLSRHFTETKRGLRFTIPDSIRMKLMQRLLELNHQRPSLKDANDHSKALLDMRGKRRPSKIHDDDLPIIHGYDA